MTPIQTLSPSESIRDAAYLAVLGGTAYLIKKGISQKKKELPKSVDEYRK